MKKIVALVSCATSAAHARMAAAALEKMAQVASCQVKIEIESPQGVGDRISPEEIAACDVVIVAADHPVDRGRFGEKPIFETSTSNAIRNTRQLLNSVLSLFPDESVAAPVPELPRKKLVAVTACPTGIAHTFMAAKALQNSAEALGYDIRVETQGSVGAKNSLTEQEIAEADAVIIAAETKVALERFAGKPVYSTSTKHALHNGREVIELALAQHVSEPGHFAEKVENLKAERSHSRTGPYKHLMTGVSYMLPVVIAGGLAIALAFAFGGIYAGDQPGTLAAALNQIGSGTAFALFVAVLSGFIAFSIADRPGIAPGLVGGMLAHNLGAGFLGGIAAGFLAGYLTKFLADRIKLPANLEGLKPVLLLPFLSTISVGLLMIYVVAPPVETVMTALEGWLNQMRGANAGMLGLILGAMMAFDTGGPVNKAAYTFAVGLLASHVNTPMAAVMAAGMTPPIGMAIAAWTFRKKFDREEREAAGPAFVLGLAFITEGAIPFAAKDPFRVIPALMIGSAVAGAISMMGAVDLLAPHGGIFAAMIPGAVKPILPYLLAIVAGSLVTAATVVLLKPNRAVL